MVFFCFGPDWTGLDRTGPDWTGLDRTGPDWTGHFFSGAHEKSSTSSTLQPWPTLFMVMSILELRNLSFSPIEFFVELILDFFSMRSPAQTSFPFRHCFFLIIFPSIFKFLRHIGGQRIGRVMLLHH